MGDVQSVTRTSRWYVSSIWPNGVMGLLVLNWPLLLLFPLGPHVGSLRDELLIIAVFMAIAATTFGYCICRQRGHGSAMPVLTASILSFLMIIAVGHAVRAGEFHRAKEAEAVSLLDLDSSQEEFVKISNATFELQSLYWEDVEVLTVFPFLGHKDRLCAAPIVDSKTGAAAPSKAWGLASVRLDGRNIDDCESLLKSLTTVSMVLKGIQEASEIKTILGALENANRSDRLSDVRVFKIVAAPPISSEWLRALLIFAIVFLNGALFYIFSLEGVRSSAKADLSANP